MMMMMMTMAAVKCNWPDVTGNVSDVHTVGAMYSKDPHPDTAGGPVGRKEIRSCH